MAIHYDQKGDAVAFTGKDVHTFNAAALCAGLGLWAAGLKPHRSWTSLRVALEQATRYTGKRYKGRKDIERARADLEMYVQTNKANAEAER